MFTESLNPTYTLTYQYIGCIRHYGICSVRNLGPGHPCGDNMFFGDLSRAATTRVSLFVFWGENKKKTNPNPNPNPDPELCYAI